MSEKMLENLSHQAEFMVTLAGKVMEGPPKNWEDSIEIGEILLNTAHRLSQKDEFKDVPPAVLITAFLLAGASYTEALRITNEQDGISGQD